MRILFVMVTFCHVSMHVGGVELVCALPTCPISPCSFPIQHVGACGHYDVTMGTL